MSPLDQEKVTNKQREKLFRRFGYKARFPGQHDGEETVVTLRRHIWAFLFEITILLGAAILPIVLFVLLRSFIPDLLDPPNSNILALLLSLYAFFVTLYFFVVWIDRYFDVWVITNERLIDVEQKSFFNRTTSELELDKIQDVTVEVKGVLPTLFHYGTIHVQTAAIQRNFSIQDIKYPYVVKDILIELERAYTERHPRLVKTAEDSDSTSPSTNQNSSLQEPPTQTESTTTPQDRS
ncbi:MAG: PH domain-containing protein [Candidatus Doudnabacteria bacterium]|nr:PH domain-containing protein [Candidatus Doudnabacteria bacterium]MCA9387648.1 PH domain-containing protein [Candidatus Andersenbacteria bacterium]